MNIARVTGILLIGLATGIGSTLIFYHQRARPKAPDLTAAAQMFLDPQGQYDFAMQALEAAGTDPVARSYTLGMAAKASYNMGLYDQSRSYAEELMRLAPGVRDNAHYESEVQDYNITLGRLALRDGKISEAEKYLMDSIASPSELMERFGPNTSLAKDLLEKGEKDVVLQYLSQCRKFWKNDNGKIDQWISDIQSGKTPRFGANLLL